VLRKYFNPQFITLQCQQIRSPLYLIQDKHTHLNTAIELSLYESLSRELPHAFNTVGFLPALYPERLGCPGFTAAHGTRFPYIVGAMANGIATAEMVIETAKIGCIGFFGAAGLPYEKVLQNIKYIQSHLTPNQINWGSNLIHSPHEPDLEEKVTELYLQHHVHRISASAYLQLNNNIVHFACKGLHVDKAGKIIRRNHIFAKISRLEVAKQFMSPAPDEILQSLLQSGKITTQEAELAKHVPVAQDITVESDSGGHTDNRPLSALFSSIQTLAKNIVEKYRYQDSIRLGAAGGIGTPASAAAAFSLGASYILTGSINQSTLESGLSAQGKQLLLQTDIADIAMAPAADMFELGVNVQVLKRGTLFAQRAKKLYEIYNRYHSIDEIPAVEKLTLEKQIFKMPLAQVWEETAAFFQERDTRQLEKANANPKHHMALIFRWYLGLSSYWAISGNTDRTADFQIWCGPAMGAFNHWLRGTVLEPLQERKVSQIALNILEGAAVITRAHQCRSFNIIVPPEAFHFTPQLMNHL
jgi:trans-AT polyketide synthase/acyltransferase/oxidoreductase domain-containing protein